MNRYLFVKTEDKATMISLDYKLEDDNTEHGGIAFVGETLGHFLDDIDEFPDNIFKLNKILQECGIKPIEV